MELQGNIRVFARVRPMVEVSIQFDLGFVTQTPSQHDDICKLPLWNYHEM